MSLASCSLLASAVACADAERVGSPVDSLPPALRELPPSLSGVTTGGHWSHSDSEGFFRIVVLDEGWEHIRSSVFIQWLSATSPDSGLILHATVALDSLLVPPVEWLEAYAVGTPRLLLEDDRWLVRVCGTDSYSGRQRRWIVRLGGPGVWEATDVPALLPGIDPWC